MTQKGIIKRLEDFGIDKVREAMLNGVFGDIGSINHDIASSWLSSKEKEEEDAMSLRAEKREKENLIISRMALLIAIIAVIISIITAIIK